MFIKLYNSSYCIAQFLVLGYFSLNKTIRQSKMKFPMRGQLFKIHRKMKRRLEQTFSSSKSSFWRWSSAMTDLAFSNCCWYFSISCVKRECDFWRASFSLSITSQRCLYLWRSWSLPWSFDRLKKEIYTTRYKTHIADTLYNGHLSTTAKFSISNGRSNFYQNIFCKKTSAFKWQ